MPIGNLDHLTKCPLCQKEYGRFNLTVLDQTKEQTRLHLKCDYCESASLVFVVANQNGILSLGMVTDVTKEEARRALDKDPVSQDDVMDVYAYLKQVEKAAELI